MAIWMGYLRGLYGAESMNGGARNFAVPLTALVGNWKILLAEAGRRGLASHVVLGGGIMLAVIVQAVYLFGRPRPRNAWWRVGAMYAVFMLVLGPAVWEGSQPGGPGAASRVLLPVQVAFNLMLVDSRRFWWWFVPGNLTLLAGLHVLEVPVLAGWL